MPVQKISQTPINSEVLDGSMEAEASGSKDLQKPSNSPALDSSKNVSSDTTVPFDSEASTSEFDDTVPEFVMSIQNKQRLEDKKNEHVTTKILKVLDGVNFDHCIF